MAEINLKYEINENLMFDEDIGEYVAYGMDCYYYRNNEKVLILHISDISVEKSVVQELVDKCNEFDASYLHIFDIIEDMLLL